MKMLRPTAITDSNLTSSTVVENDYAAWSSATAYVTGNRVIRVSTHRIYECLVGNTSFTPETNTTGTSPKWLDIGPTNYFGMFDSQVGTATTIASSLTVVLTPGTVDGLGLLQLIGDSVRVKMTTGGTTVYDKTYSLIQGVVIGNWYDYFFSPIVKKTDLTITDLPPYASGVITITITAASGNVSCGMCVVGTLLDLGYTQQGCSVSIVDYSRKDIDAFGNPTITKRKFVKTMTTKIFMQTSQVDQIAQTLALYRSSPILWIGADNLFTSLVVYGFYRDWSIDISYPNGCMCNLSVEGLI